MKRQRMEIGKGKVHGTPLITLYADDGFPQTYIFNHNGIWSGLSHIPVGDTTVVNNLEAHVAERIARMVIPFQNNRQQVERWAA